MKNRNAIVVFIVSLAFLSVCLCSCKNHKRYTEEEKEADQILSYLSENHCLEELSWCDTIAVEGKIELCFWGDCDLQDAFDVSEAINSYIDTHPDSILHKKQLELNVTLFSTEPGKLEHDRQDYYARVTKSAEEEHIDSLKINTPDTIQMSVFKNCQVPYKIIETSYNMEFDDYEAIFSVEGLEYFIFQ